ncbi:MAG TPA: hypothetical protein VMU19_14980 [Bryobacteraceae bacterium]|nr:hypothetical protein [Bryobacteraceae bacterium]
MRYFLTFPAALAAAFLQVASAQTAPPAPDPAASAKAAPPIEAPAVPARPNLTDYQGHAATGVYNIAGEYTGHNVVTPLASFTNEDYVTVEVAIYGPKGARLKLSYQDFSLRVNGKKGIPAESYVLLERSLKDPSYIPPEEAQKKKDNSDGGVPVVGEAPSDRNPQWHPVPFPITHAMDVRVEKAALAEGERDLPQAGLIFFPYHGRDNGVKTVELQYDGPAGRALVPLHP